MIAVEDIIERQAALGTGNEYHLFIEYTDGKRGVVNSFQTLEAAKRKAKLFNAAADPVIYDNTAEPVWTLGDPL